MDGEHHVDRYITLNPFNVRTEAMQSTAGDYWSIWKQYVLQGVVQEDMLPPALMQSWRRCVTLGLDPYGEPDSEEITRPTLTSLSQQLLSLIKHCSMNLSISD